MTVTTTARQIIRAGAGLVLGAPAGCRDRFLIDSEDTGGRFSLVEHLLAPRSIAAPLHVHTREDEYSFVLEGRVSVRLGDDEHVAEVGDLVLKPRGQWHTFWNAVDEPARLLELISPGGLEHLFRTMGLADADTDLGPLVASYACEGDPAATEPIVRKYGLTFG
jgi:mannose-6-phosphate isomerase-like protein (cupin superfamily)